MVIKGTSCAGARRLATHLTRTDTNERAEVWELYGVAADDLRGSLLEMEAVAAGTRTTKPFYHASINTRADEKLTDDQRMYAIGVLEDKLGLSDQPRVVVIHQKEGREHCHIVWSRIDLERMRAISDSHNYRKHEEVARDLERQFGHERVQGAHAEREGKARPDRTPSHSEMLQAERGAVSPQEAKELITNVWRRTDSGQSFRSALEERDWLLARGDRRDFVAIDPYCGTHSLARRVEGAKAKDIRVRMADIDPALLPSVAEARARQRERQAEPLGHHPEAARPIFGYPPSDEVEEARMVSGPLDWTDRGGMVAQQQSAIKSIRREVGNAQPQAKARDASATKAEDLRANVPQATPTPSPKASVDSDQPLRADEVLGRHTDPALQARYEMQQRRQRQQEASASPTPNTPAEDAARINVPAEKRTEQRRPYDKFTRDSTGGKFIRDLNEDDPTRGPDDDHSRGRSRGGRKRSR